MLQNIQSQQFMHTAASAHAAAMQQIPGVLPTAPNMQTAVAQPPSLSTAITQSSATDAVYSYLYPTMQLPVGPGHYEDWSKVLSYRTATQDPNPVLQVHHPLPGVPTESEWAGAKLIYRAEQQQTPSAMPNSIPGAYPYLTHALPGGVTANQQAQLMQEMGLQPGQMIPQPGTQLPIGLAKNKNDKLEVCREFQRGNCSRGEQECKFAHPNEQTTIDNTDNTVTVCMDYIKGRCTREKCKYFHPPPHLQAKIKAAQHQANQASVTAVQFPGLVPPTKKPPSTMSPTILNHTPGYIHQIQMQLTGQQPSYIPSPGYHWPQGKLGGSVFCPGDLMSQTLANESLRQHLHFPMMPPMPGTPASVPIYAHQLVQNQQSADTIPVCRDFKSGSCKRPNCKYAHVTEDYVEIIDGKVTLCRYAAQSRCTRPKCKFYHPPTASGMPLMSTVPLGSLPPVVTSAAV